MGGCSVFLVFPGVFRKTIFNHKYKTIYQSLKIDQIYNEPSFEIIISIKMRAFSPPQKGNYISVIYSSLGDK